MQQATPKDKQVRNMFVYLIPVAVGNLIPLLTFPILTRVLTKEDFGLWALAQIYALVVSGLANFGLTVGYERNFFEYRDPKRGAQLLSQRPSRGNRSQKTILSYQPYHLPANFPFWSRTGAPGSTFPLSGLRS